MADLFGDGGELGYISIQELIENGVELDLHWEIKTIGEIKPNPQEVNLDQVETEVAPELPAELAD